MNILGERGFLLSLRFLKVCFWGGIRSEIRSSFF